MTPRPLAPWDRSARKRSCHPTTNQSHLPDYLPLRAMRKFQLRIKGERKPPAAFCQHALLTLTEQMSNQEVALQQISLELVRSPNRWDSALGNSTACGCGTAQCSVMHRSIFTFRTHYVCLQSQKHLKCCTEKAPGAARVPARTDLRSRDGFRTMNPTAWLAALAGRLRPRALTVKSQQGVRSQTGERMRKKRKKMFDMTMALQWNLIRRNSMQSYRLSPC